MSTEKMVMVPEEATEEMIEAVDGLEYTFGCGDEDFKGYVSSCMAEEIYAIMVAAYKKQTCTVPPE